MPPKRKPQYECTAWITGELCGLGGIIPSSGYQTRDKFRIQKKKKRKKMLDKETERREKEKMKNTSPSTIIVSMKLAVFLQRVLTSSVASSFVRPFF
jgi:hypothetical protein